MAAHPWSERSCRALLVGCRWCSIEIFCWFPVPQSVLIPVFLTSFFQGAFRWCHVLHVCSVGRCRRVLPYHSSRLVVTLHSIPDDTIARKVNTSDASAFARICGCCSARGNHPSSCFSYRYSRKPCDAVWGVIWLIQAFIFFALGVLVGLVSFKVCFTLLWCDTAFIRTFLLEISSRAAGDIKAFPAFSSSIRRGRDGAQYPLVIVIIQSRAGCVQHRIGQGCFTPFLLTNDTL